MKSTYNTYPIGSMYGIYAHIWGILMVNVSLYTIHGSYGYVFFFSIQLRVISITIQYMGKLPTTWGEPGVENPMVSLGKGSTFMVFFFSVFQINVFVYRMVIAIWGFPKMGVPLNYPFLDGIFPWKTFSKMGVPPFLETPIYWITTNQISLVFFSHPTVAIFILKPEV